jgi:tetratricopeptide (TPR) repeat protein
MPVKTYMVVDDRHDHSFRIPEPRLTLELGVPNTCNQCHADRDAQWALDALQSWGVQTNPQPGHAAVLSSAWSGHSAALPGLLALANQTTLSSMLRASAIVATQDFPAQETLGLLPQWLSSKDPRLRASAVRSMDWVPVAERYALLRDLISDDSKVVRMAVAQQLSSFPVSQLPPAYTAEIKALWQEYVESMLLNADMPEEQMNLGNFYTATGDVLAAEKAYLQALKLAPAYVPAMLNLADLYRANNMDPKAEKLLLKALEQAPQEASAQHAMGLLKVRQRSLDQALPYLRAAATMQAQNSRYRYVYAVALWETGNQSESISELEDALARNPGNRDLVSALASYYQQLGENEKLKQLMKQYSPQD